MRFLKLRYIIPSILVLVLSIGILVYFTGGLSTSAYTYNNDQFVKDESYLFYDQFIKENEDKIVNNKCLVMDNEKFALVIDVNTTIITLVEKDANWSSSNFLSGKLYDTANATGADSEKSNIILKYFGSNGKVSSKLLDSFQYSVNYADKMRDDTYYKYYRLKYLTDEANNVTGLDILYQIGDFNNPAASYPEYFLREDMFDIFVGNLYFNVPRMDALGKLLYDVNSQNSFELISENGYTGTYEEWTQALSGLQSNTNSIALKKMEEMNAAVIYDHVLANGLNYNFRQWFDFVQVYESDYNALSSSDKDTQTRIDFIWSRLAQAGYNKSRLEFKDYVEGLTRLNYMIYMQPIELEDGKAVSSVDAYDIAVRGGYTGSAALWCTEMIKAEMIYTGEGWTRDAECAAYLEEKGYTVTENYSRTAKDEYGNPLLANTWSVSGLADEAGRLNLEIGVDYNTASSPCQANPFTNNYIINNKLINSSVYVAAAPDPKNPYYDEAMIGKWVLNAFEFIDDSLPFLQRKAVNSGSYQQLNTYMYNSQTAYVNDDGIPVGNFFTMEYHNTNFHNWPMYYDYNGDGKLSNDELVQIGGFQAKDEEGNYLYDEDGKPVRAAFTLEQAAVQNEHFSSLIVDPSICAFEVCLRVSLNENGLVAKIVHDSIGETSLTGERLDYDSEGNETIISQAINQDNKLYEISVFPYMTANNDNKSVGQIVIPDGSGAVISFNSIKDKQSVNAYKKHLYGIDLTLPLKKAPENSNDLMLGMFGYLDYGDVQVDANGNIVSDTRKGIVAIVEQGASMTSIEADFYRQASDGGKYNYARFLTSLREQEEVSITNGTSFSKWTDEMFQGDIVYQFLPIVMNGADDTLDYVDVASTYRQYLIDKYELQDKVDTTTTHNIELNFLGQFDKKELALGFVYDADKSLTTFQQAIEIIKELEEKGVNNFGVAYTAWTKEGMRDKISANDKVSSVLGGKKDLEELSNFLKERNYNFYPEYWLASGYGYDFAYGSLKYSSKSIGSTYSSVAQFVVATGLVDNSNSGSGFLSPRFYKSLAVKYLENYHKLDVSGIRLTDVGNARTADYNRKYLLYTETSSKIQTEVLQMFNEGLDVMVPAPYDYAIPYLNTIVDAPLETTMYPIIDYSIPLYQLVLSGIIDYAGTPVNHFASNSTTWYLLKAIETGSNLQFFLSAEDTSILLETNYTNYYNAYYRNWKQKIIEMNKQLNDLGIYKSRLVDHKYLSDNVVQVAYENGLTIIINFDKDIYYDVDSGQSVAKNWYVVIEEGAE